MKYLAILGVAAFMLIGFVYYTLFITPAHDLSQEAGDSLAKLADDSKVVPPRPVVPEQGTGTLNSLRLLGANAECTIVYKPADGTSAIEGTYFVSGGSMRGDFLIDMPEVSEKVLSSMILNGADVYVWSVISGQSYGVKMATADVSQTEGRSNTPVGLDVDVEYKCKPWAVVDGSVFVPPSNVLFKDAKELQKTGMEYGTVYEEGTGEQ
ncbi:MAG: hypothetical protein RLZZ230_667 [Candidatus Parcubacteria bacterium]|jgi:hypothetical protein